jgi:hypothetical protein
MDSNSKFNLNSFPIEKEFRVLSVRRRLHELSREELEEFLTESLVIMTKLAHLVEQMRDYIGDLEGKNP